MRKEPRQTIMLGDHELTFFQKRRTRGRITLVYKTQEGFYAYDPPQGDLYPEPRKFGNVRLILFVAAVAAFFNF